MIFKNKIDILFIYSIISDTEIAQLNLSHLWKVLSHSYQLIFLMFMKSHKLSMRHLVHFSVYFNY